MPRSGSAARTQRRVSYTRALVGSAKNQANFTVFYENEKLLLRASYNRRGEVVQGQVNGLNVYEFPYGYTSNLIIEGTTLFSPDVWISDPTIR